MFQATVGSGTQNSRLTFDKVVGVLVSQLGNGPAKPEYVSMI